MRTAQTLSEGESGSAADGDEAKRIRGRIGGRREAEEEEREGGRRAWTKSEKASGKASKS